MGTEQARKRVLRCLLHSPLSAHTDGPLDLTTWTNMHVTLFWCCADPPQAFVAHLPLVPPIKQPANEIQLCGG